VIATTEHPVLGTTFIAAGQQEFLEALRTYVASTIHPGLGYLQIVPNGADFKLIYCQYTVRVNPETMSRVIDQARAFRAGYDFALAYRGLYE
jgi:hypothetical protein